MKRLVFRKRYTVDNKMHVHSLDSLHLALCLKEDVDGKLRSHVNSRTKRMVESKVNQLPVVVPSAEDAGGASAGGAVSGIVPVLGMSAGAVAGEVGAIGGWTDD